MAVIRTPLPHSSFTMLRNCWLRDSRVSLKAKGLLGYLMSHAEGYKISQAQIVRESKDARDAVVTGLRELESAGYLVRNPGRDDRNRAGGRYAEDDYALADPFDADGKLLPVEPREIPLPFADDPRETHQSGKSDMVTNTDFPGRETRPIEEQGEKNTPAPTEQAATGDDGRHLRAVPTVGQRANVLAREHYDAVNGLVPFPGLLSIVRRAIDAGGYDDDRVRRALALLRGAGKPVTLQTLHAALETPQALTNGRARAPAGPYRNPDPTTDPDAFRGAF